MRSTLSRLLAGGVLALAILVPMGWILRGALLRSDAGEAWEILAGIDVQGLLATSILLALLATGLALLLGLPLALMLNLRRFPGRGWIGSLYFLPLVIPPHIHVIAWTRVIGDRGWLTTWLKEAVGFPLDVRAPLADPATSDFLGHIYLGPAWILACAYFPLITLSVSSGVRALDGEAVEAARLAGGRLRTLTRVVLPLLAPRIMAGAFFVFVLSLGTYPVVSLLDTPVLIQKIFYTFQKVDQQAGALMSVPLVAVAGLAVFMLGLVERRAPTAQGGLRPPRLEARSLGTSFLALLPLILAAGIPLWSLLAEAGPLSFSGDVADNYQSVFDRVRPAFVDSLLFTLLGVLVLVLVSYPLGRTLAWRRAGGLEALSLSALAFPPVVIGVALLLFWADAAAEKVTVGFLTLAAALMALAVTRRRRGGRRALKEALLVFVVLVGAGFLAWAAGLPGLVYREGMILLVLAYLARFLPFTVRLFKNGFRALDPLEVEAARLSGHGVLGTMLRVEWPRMKACVTAGAVMSYVLCFTELAATLMVIPEGRQSVQIRIFNMIHYRAVGEVAALCVMTIILAAAPVVLFALLSRRKVDVL